MGKAIRDSKPKEKHVKMKYILLAVLLFSAVTNKAQVSMMPDVSQAYLAKLIDTAKANYPKFKATAARVNASKAAYKKAKAGVYDFISLSYVYYPGNTYPVYGNNSISTALNGYQAGVFLNVGSMLQKPATVTQAREEYKAVAMENETIELNIEQEVRKRYFTYLEYLNIVKIKVKAMGDVEDVQKHIKYKFEKGEVGFDIYNQALLSYSTYSQEKITAEASLLIAKSSLEELLGTTLENIK
jgi:outer membrane protein TolC